MSQQSLPKGLNTTSWIMRGVSAIVFLGMGALPKLTGDDYSVELFEQVGMGTTGMYATGVAELLAGILILLPRANWIGASIGALVMVGAIGAHLFTDLGIAPELHNPRTQAVEANPMMFPFAMLLLGLCLGVIALRKLHPGAPAGGAPDPAPESDEPG